MMGIHRLLAAVAATRGIAVRSDRLREPSITSVRTQRTPLAVNGYELDFREHCIRLLLRREKAYAHVRARGRQHD